MKKRILDMDIDEITISLAENGFKKFRAKQVFDWIYKGIEDFSEGKNLPKDLVEFLNSNYYANSVSVHKVFESSLDSTKKFLMKLDDGNIIETVFMKYKHGNSICLTTQVGCKMGCTFCASTIGGHTRNLTSGEMMGQILAVQRYTGERISNIVLMGSGEPLDNYTEVVKFIRTVNQESTLNISQRNITLSTCGLVPEIDMLSHEDLKVTLAISLHATSDDLRNEIMPINRKYNIEDLIEACKRYVAKSGRRITFEYTLVDGVNDSEKHARELAKLLKGMLCHVNLIPINEVREKPYKAAKKAKVDAFLKVLTKNRINATVRRELGDDIDAACGQLRNDHI